MKSRTMRERLLAFLLTLAVLISGYTDRVTGTRTAGCKRDTDRGSERTGISAARCEYARN